MQLAIIALTILLSSPAFAHKCDINWNKIGLEAGEAKLQQKSLHVSKQSLECLGEYKILEECSKKKSLNDCRFEMLKACGVCK